MDYGILSVDLTSQIRTLKEAINHSKNRILSKSIYCIRYDHGEIHKVFFRQQKIAIKTFLPNLFESSYETQY